MFNEFSKNRLLECLTIDVKYVPRNMIKIMIALRRGSVGKTLPKILNSMNRSKGTKKRLKVAARANVSRREKFLLIRIERQATRLSPGRTMIALSSTADRIIRSMSIPSIITGSMATPATRMKIMIFTLNNHRIKYCC